MSAPLRLPLFPLHSVLFPQGKMNLRIFEARYLDMIGRCMKEEANFGVCLIAEGEEVGMPAVPHRIGTEARITDWDMSEPGILGLVIRGERRFRVLEQVVDESGLITGIVEWLDEPAPVAISEKLQSLQPLMQMILRDAGETRIARPHALEDAAWVGYRYAEVLPIPALARQKLLELEDTELRLSIIAEYLIKQGLLKHQNPSSDC